MNGSPIYRGENEIPTPDNPPTQNNNDAAPPPIDSIDTTEPVIKILTKEEVEVQIGLKELQDTYPDNLEEIDMLFDCVCDVLAVENPPTPTFRIARQNMPFIAVKNMFKLLEKRHIEYVIDCLNKNNNKNKININIKSYLLTSLFNAPRTVSYYFDRKFQKPPQEQSVNDITFEMLVRKSMKF